MNKSYTAKQHMHIERIKSMPCGVCDHLGPSDAHHIDQNLPYSCIPLCKDCHQGTKNGIHGQKNMWRVMKLDELTVLCKTMEKLLDEQI